MRDFRKAEVEETKKEKKRSFVKTWLVATGVLSLIILVLVSLPLRYDNRITYNYKTGDPADLRTIEDIEAEFEGMISDANKEWLDKLKEMEAGIIEIIEEKTDMMYYKWTSSRRLDSFVDEYYGYFKGFKFIYLYGRDLLGDEKEYLEEELKRMIQVHLLYDLETDMESLFVDLESYITEETGRFMAGLLRTLDETFSQEELEKLDKGFSVGDIDLTPSELQTLIRVGADIKITPMITSSIFCGVAKIGKVCVARTGGQRIVSAVVSKVTASIMGKLFTGVVIGLVVDYALAKASKSLNQDNLKRDLKTEMSSFRSALDQKMASSFRYALGGLASRRLIR